MKTIKEPNYDIWGTDPINAKKNESRGLDFTICNCDCSWDGDGNPTITCTGSISN